MCEWDVARRKEMRKGEWDTNRWGGGPSGVRVRQSGMRRGEVGDANEEGREKAGLRGEEGGSDRGAGMGGRGGEIWWETNWGGRER